jgi:hypothetical protein
LIILTTLSLKPVCNYRAIWSYKVLQIGIIDPAGCSRTLDCDKLHVDRIGGLEREMKSPTIPTVGEFSSVTGNPLFSLLARAYLLKTMNGAKLLCGRSKLILSFEANFLPAQSWNQSIVALGFLQVR